MHLEVLDMALTKIKLGKYLELFSQKCNIPNLTNDQVSGVNKEKEFFEPSTQVGGDTSKYKIVPPNFFACNLMHVGRDVVLPIAYNHSGKNKIVSPAYFVFKFKDNDELISDYFFIFLKSSERDRYFWFHTDGSVRDGMSWEDFVDVEIELPSIEIQRKYVEIYKGMVENQAAYETGLEDLKLVCDGYIEDLRKKSSCEAIKPYIEYCFEKNTSLLVKKVCGVESSGKYIDTRAKLQGVDISNYTIIKKGYIAYNPSRINLGSIALYRENELCLVSPMYEVFRVKEQKKLMPEYLMMWLNRKEFYRYTWFYSAGSVRDTFNYNLMEEVQIPIPPIEIQQATVDIYNAYILRKEINEQLKLQIKNICPVLIKGAVEEAKRS